MYNALIVLEDEGGQYSLEQDVTGFHVLKSGSFMYVSGDDTIVVSQNTWVSVELKHELFEENEHSETKLRMVVENEDEYFVDKLSVDAETNVVSGNIGEEPLYVVLINMNKNETVLSRTIEN